MRQQLDLKVLDIPIKSLKLSHWGKKTNHLYSAYERYALNIRTLKSWTFQLKSCRKYRVQIWTRRIGWLSLISDKVDFKARSITRHKEGVLVINFLSLSSKSTLQLVFTGTEFYTLHFSFSSWLEYPTSSSYWRNIARLKEDKGNSFWCSVSANSKRIGL